MSAEEKTMKKVSGSLRQSDKVFEKKITKKVGCKYLLYLPEGYGERGKKWPLMMFLHGAGERGDNLELVKKHGPAKLVKQGKDFEFIIVSPQCPEGPWWPEKLDTLIALLDYIESNYEVDTDRVYLPIRAKTPFVASTLLISRAGSRCLHKHVRGVGAGEGGRG